ATHTTPSCFFFSSRRRHTRFSRDWSSDVCSSDLSPSPLLDRTIGAVYPPGSTFKLVVTAAALQDGYTPDSEVTGAATITLPGTEIGRASCRERVEIRVEDVAREKQEHGGNDRADM